MNIVICGAGEVGRFAAEVLVGAGHRVTIVDRERQALRSLADSTDVATIPGDCSGASVLTQAGVDDADLLIAATSSDEVNLLTASLGRGLGASRTVARVHHRQFLDTKVFDYGRHLGIDRLICPEHAAADAISRCLRNPGAIAIESFARGRVQIQEFEVPKRCTAIGQTLGSLRMPQRTRLVAITRGPLVFLPGADTTIERGDVVTLLGDTRHFDEALGVFGAGPAARQRIALFGGPSMGVWLCRALQGGRFAIRLFEPDRERAEQLAEKLDWVTVLSAEPTDQSVFAEEQLHQVDAFVALTGDDEVNILSSAWVKTQGVRRTIAVVQRPQYAHLLRHIGIDRAFSPRTTAVREIVRTIEGEGLRRVASLAEGTLSVFRGRAVAQAECVDTALRDLRTRGQWVIAAVEHAGDVFVPTADDRIAAGDTVLIVGPNEDESHIARLLGTSAVDADQFPMLSRAEQAGTG